MVDQRVQIARLEESRQALAKERDNAIEQVNKTKAQMVSVLKKAAKQQQDAVRWIALFLLLEGKREVRFDESFLLKANDWVVERAHNKDTATIVWRIVPKAEFEARQKSG